MVVRDIPFVVMLMMSSNFLGKGVQCAGPSAGVFGIDDDEGEGDERVYSEQGNVTHPQRGICLHNVTRFSQQVLFLYDPLEWWTLRVPMLETMKFSHTH